MKIIIAFTLLFIGITSFNAYASSDKEHMQVINQTLDEIEGLVSPQTVYQNTQEQSHQATTSQVEVVENPVSQTPTSQTPTSQASTYQMPPLQTPTPQREEQQNEDTLNPAFHNRINTFSLDYQAFYSHYSEPHNARTVAGGWNGFEGKYIYRPPKGSLLNTPVFNYYAVEGLYATGKGIVSRNLFGGEATNPPTFKVNIKNIPGYMFDNRILAGRDFLPQTSLRLTPYTGFGVRYKTDQFANHYDVYQNYLGSPVAAVGYDFSDLYYYIPAGITFDLLERSRDEISFNLEYDYIVESYETDDFSDFNQYTIPLGFSNQNFRYNTDNGWGARTSIKFLKHFSLVDIYIQPYLRYWHVDETRAVSGSVGGGPYSATANKNTTIEAGSSLGVEF